MERDKSIHGVDQDACQHLLHGGHLREVLGPALPSRLPSTGTHRSNKLSPGKEIFVVFNIYEAFAYASETVVPFCFAQESIASAWKTFL